MHTPEAATRPTSRRAFLRAASATGVLLAAPLPFQAQQSISAPSADPTQEQNPTLDATLKFHSDGKVKPFAGNTVICHLPQQCRFRDGAIALHDALLQSSFAPKLGILPPESYHMTIYPGANDQNRPHSSWPGGVPLDAPIEECNRVMLERMRAVRLNIPFPLRVSINLAETMRYGRASTLRMQGADAASERALRALRDRLAEVYQYRAPDHASYGFHITIAYTMAESSPAEWSAYRAILQKAIDQIAATTPVLELGLPEFCTFPNMYRFDTEVMLRTS